jgi:predicted phosphodiesterase
MSESLVLVLSDLHFGKRTATYNIDVATRRLLSITKKIKVNHRDIDEIVVLLVGDLVDGEDIYKTQHAHLDGAAVDGVDSCVNALWSMLVDLRSRFNRPIRVETVPGNHGRTSKTANERTNWDNVVARMLEQRSSTLRAPRIRVRLNDDAFQMVKIKTHNFLICHHGVPHTGTPAMIQRVAGWLTSFGCDVLVHGHWHDWRVARWMDRMIVCNGALCGADELAQRMGKPSRPSQTLLVVGRGAIEQICFLNLA